MISLAVGIFLLYCLIIALIYGVQESISKSFYTTGQRLYFTGMMLTVNYPPTPKAMGWASGVNTLTNVNSSS